MHRQGLGHVLSRGLLESNEFIRINSGNQGVLGVMKTSLRSLARQFRQVMAVEIS